MKRQYFDISLNGTVVATTFTWNSAIRTIERLVRERSVAVGVVYKLVDSLTEGPDKWHFTHGHRTWQSPHETWTHGRTIRTPMPTLRYDIKLRGSIPTC